MRFRFNQNDDTGWEMQQAPGRLLGRPDSGIYIAVWDIGHQYNYAQSRRKAPVIVAIGRTN